MVSLDELAVRAKELLEEIQKDMLETARAHRDAHTYTAVTYEEFVKTINEKPGFVKAMWCGCQECEDKIKEDTAATSRCIPAENLRKKWFTGDGHIKKQKSTGKEGFRHGDSAAAEGSVYY